MYILCCEYLNCQEKKCPFYTALVELLSAKTVTVHCKFLFRWCLLVVLMSNSLQNIWLNHHGLYLFPKLYKTRCIHWIYCTAIPYSMDKICMKLLGYLRSLLQDFLIGMHCSKDAMPAST